MHLKWKVIETKMIAWKTNDPFNCLINGSIVEENARIDFGLNVTIDKE